VLSDIPLKAPLGFMNETMLFQVQWGFRKKGRSADAFKQHIDSEVRPIYRQLVRALRKAKQILQPAGGVRLLAVQCRR
jgi:5-methyltetrahydrofolate--homocysteine methyltransferase